MSGSINTTTSQIIATTTLAADDIFANALSSARQAEMDVPVVGPELGESDSSVIVTDLTDIPVTPANDEQPASQNNLLIASAAIGASFSQGGVFYTFTQGSGAPVLQGAGQTFSGEAALKIISEALSSGALRIGAAALGTFLGVFLWGTEAPGSTGAAIAAQSAAENYVRQFPFLKVDRGGLGNVLPGGLGITTIWDASHRYVLMTWNTVTGVFTRNPNLNADGSITSFGTGTTYYPDGTSIAPRTPALTTPSVVQAPPVVSAPAVPTQILPQLPAPGKLLDKILQAFRDNGVPELLVTAISKKIINWLMTSVPKNAADQSRALLWLISAAGAAGMQTIIDSAKASIDPVRLFEAAIAARNLPPEAEAILRPIFASMLVDGVKKMTDATGINWIDQARWLINFASSASLRGELSSKFATAAAELLVSEYSILHGVAIEGALKTAFVGEILHWLVTDSTLAQREDFNFLSMFSTIKDALLGSDGRGATQLAQTLLGAALAATGGGTGGNLIEAAQRFLNGQGTSGTPPGGGGGGGFWANALKLLVAGGAASYILDSLTKLTSIGSNSSTVANTINNFKWKDLSERGVIVQENVARLTTLSALVDTASVNLKIAADPTRLAVDQAKALDPKTRDAEYKRVSDAFTTYLGALKAFRDALVDLAPTLSTISKSSNATDAEHVLAASLLEKITQADRDIVSVTGLKNNIDAQIVSFKLTAQQIETSGTQLQNTATASRAQIEAAIAGLETQKTTLSQGVLGLRASLTTAEGRLTALEQGLPAKKTAWVQAESTRDTASYSDSAGGTLITAWNNKVANNGGRTQLPRDANGQIATTISDIGLAYRLAAQRGLITGASVIEAITDAEQLARAETALTSITAQGGFKTFNSQLDARWDASSDLSAANAEIAGVRQEIASLRSDITGGESKVAERSAAIDAEIVSLRKQLVLIKSAVDAAGDSTLLANADGRISIEDDPTNPDANMFAGDGALGEKPGISADEIRTRLSAGQVDYVWQVVLDDAAIGRTDIFDDFGIIKVASPAAVTSNPVGKAIGQIQTDLKDLLNIPLTQEEAKFLRWKIDGDGKLVARAASDTAGISQSVLDKVAARDATLNVFNLGTMGGIMGALRARILVEPGFAQVVEAYFISRGIPVPDGKVLPNVGSYGLTIPSAKALLDKLPDTDDRADTLRDSPWLTDEFYKPLGLSGGDLALVGKAFQQFNVLQGTGTLPTVAKTDFDAGLEPTIFAKFARAEMGQVLVADAPPPPPPPLPEGGDDPATNPVYDLTYYSLPNDGNFYYYLTPRGTARNAVYGGDSLGDARKRAADRPDLMDAFAQGGIQALDRKENATRGNPPPSLPPFSAEDFIAANPDLPPSAKASRFAATQYYVEQGYYEGRKRSLTDTSAGTPRPKPEPLPLPDHLKSDAAFAAWKLLNPSYVYVDRFELISSIYTNAYRTP